MQMTFMYLRVTRKAQECHLNILFPCWQTLLHIYYIIIIVVVVAFVLIRRCCSCCCLQLAANEGYHCTAELLMHNV